MSLSLSLYLISLALSHLSLSLPHLSLSLSQLTMAASSSELVKRKKGASCVAWLRGWCSLHNCQEKCLNCFVCCRKPPQPPLLLVEQPPRELTLEDLDTLIAHVEAEVERLLPSSSSTRVTTTTTVISHWEQTKQGLSTFMDSLPGEFRKEVGKESGKLLLPLLTQALGGVGGVHWLGLGFSFIAWSLDNLAKTNQNQEDCLRLLQQSIYVLKNLKEILAASTKDNDSLHELQDGVEKAFQCAIICTSNLNDHVLLRFLKASNATEAIGNLEKELGEAINRTNNYLLRRIYIDAPKPQHQVIHPNLDDGKVDQGEVKEAAMEYLLKDCNDILSVCLHGMGGIGKSTLGLTIFSEFQKKEKAYRFCMVELPLGIEDEELTKLQEEIIEKVCNHKSPTISKTIDGRTLLQKEFQVIKNPIFLYLDNVLEAHQLKELIPMSLYFPPGSRILVTTRHTYVYNSLKELNIKHCKPICIEVRKLNEESSKKLLWHNIGEEGKQKDISNNLIEDLEKNVLTLCDGLPLALTVVGRYIASSDDGPTHPNVWKKVVDAMEGAKPLHGEDKDELYSRIMFSIESLKGSFRASFLDIVIYGVGKGWEYGERLVGELDLEVLHKRALVQKRKRYELDRFGIVEVHDVLKAMAMKMAQEDNHDIRITSQDQFEEKIGSMEKVVALQDVRIEAVQLMKMPQLRFLSRVTIEGECQDTPSPKHLVMVNSMRSATSRPFNLNKSTCLKEVSWFSEYAYDLEMIRGCTQLQVLSLYDWQLLENVDAIESFRCLTQLTLSSCERLQRLPEGIGCLTSLTVLNLSRCAGLQSLPEGLASLTGLTALDLSRCAGLQSLPEALASLTGLTVLDLFGCTGLPSLPEALASLTGLTKLDLVGCAGLQSLPEGLASLTGLTKLSLFGCARLQSLPEGLASLTGLTELDLSRCARLQSLPEGLASLTGLTKLHLYECARLHSLPEGLASLTGLTSLQLIYCAGLQSLPEGLASLTGLTNLHLSGCEGLQFLPEGLASLTGLTELFLFECAGLHSLPEDLASLTGLTHLELSRCAGLQSLPEGLGSLTGLIYLGLSECAGLRSLPEGLTNLTGLTTLTLFGCAGLLSLPEGLASLTGLTMLDLSGCGGLESLPEGLGSLTGLTTLDLSNCAGLESLPESLGRLTGLTTLNLSGCGGLQSLPASLKESEGFARFMRSMEEAEAEDSEVEDSEAEAEEAEAEDSEAEDSE